MPMSSDASAPAPAEPTRRPRRAVLVTHEAFGADDTGVVRRFLLERGFEVTHHSVFPDGRDYRPRHPLPDPEGADLVVVFGSFAHAWEPRHKDWVAAEVAWVRGVLDLGIPYIGICFGGQLLAAAWGGTVEPGDGSEIGMLTFPTVPGCPVPGGPWFSWHSDRVVLPPDAELLARSDFGPQIFARDRAIGVQFHPEVTRELVESWIRTDEAGLDAVYGADRLRAEVAADVETAQANLGTFLDRVIGDRG
ncbi:type 1 glutamine amidotransferase [Yinghuangia seranimata]|uniref:type 1 glutamine amidotransferase n=1 Tax=Yinghuangia seranimata TaxID=408067 RepID=UPI00248C026E|nr:type 1 glutamine amidotransferase [Yinghuangia seranimata]MDI2125077.1 type 1 glutamine amidotransferase [Yinghuangia seranimata]